MSRPCARLAIWLLIIQAGRTLSLIKGVRATQLRTSGAGRLPCPRVFEKPSLFAPRFAGFAKYLL